MGIRHLDFLESQPDGHIAETIETVRSTIVALAAIHNFLAWTFHGTYSYGTAERNKIHNLSVWALTLNALASIVYVLVPYLTVYNADTWNVPLTEEWCKWIIALSKLSVVYPKTIGLYYVYIERLFLIFKGNVYAFPKWQKYTLRSLLVLMSVSWTIVVCVGAPHGSTFLEESNTCLRHPSMAVNTTFVTIDFLMCATVTALYCRRLLIFIARLETRFLNPRNNGPGPNPAHQEADKLYFKIMVKSTVLTFVASLSTQISIVLLTLFGMPSLWVSIDSVINSWCLILIFDLYDDLFNLYPRCCCLCERLMSYYCIVCCSCACCFRSNLRPQIELQVAAQQTNTNPAPIASVLPPAGYPDLSRATGDGSRNEENANNVELQLAVGTLGPSNTVDVHDQRPIASAL